VGIFLSPSLFDFTLAALYNLPMTKTVNEKRAKTVFAELVGRVSSKKETVIVEQHGKPVVAMIDFDRYQLLTEKRERRLNVLDRVWARNRAKSARTAYKDATQAVNLARSSSSRSHRRRSA
jgi:prevent-host-death family protein